MTIKIAINGGGLAGASLAASLCTYSHLQVQVFEAASIFSEQGAAIGIGKNGQRALQLMSSKSNNLSNVLKLAGGVSNKGNKFIVGTGVHANEIIFEMPPPKQQYAEIIVHRAALLEQLLKHVPSECMYANKRLQRVEEREQDLLLHFADDTTIETDVLIGADGIHGYVRSQIDPWNKAIYAGFWDSRVLLPIEKAVSILGEEFVNVKDPRQHDYIGDGVFFIHDIIDQGKTVALAIAARSDKPWPSDRWKTVLDRQELSSLFQGWPLQQTIVDIFLDQDEPLKAAERIHVNTSSYYKGRMAIMGDAAHSMVPFQASGATQSLEDGLVLSRVLGIAKRREEITAALAAYDAVRRPRSQAIAASSLITGKIMTGGDQEAGLVPELLAKALGPRWDIINNIDLVAHYEEAQTQMKASISNEKEL